MLVRIVFRQPVMGGMRAKSNIYMSITCCKTFSCLTSRRFTTLIDEASKDYLRFRQFVAKPFLYLALHHVALAHQVS